MTTNPRIVLASSNVGKLHEIKDAFADFKNIEFIPQNEYFTSLAEESAPTFIENALLKARHAAKLSGLAALADDSGLLVDALGGKPGVLSARFAGENASDADNIHKLLQLLKHTPELERGAHFYCAMVFVSHFADPEPLISHGIWQGWILEKPQGKQGFGYDPIFYVPTHQCSAAELMLAEKNQISHRGKALQSMRTLITSSQL